MNKLKYSEIFYSIQGEGRYVGVPSVFLYEKNKDLVNPHIVGIYRGSLPIAVHLSNLFKSPMSIIKFQGIDGRDKEPVFLFDTIENPYFFI